MNNNFNLIRLVLSIFVVLAHSVAVSGGEKMWLDTVPLYHLRMTPGTLAVHMFFVISGYLITKSFINAESFSSFVRHRFLRITPALVVAWLFSYYAFNAFNGYQGNPVVGFNLSLWSLPWEVICYAFVAALGALGLLDRKSFNTIFVVVWLFYFYGFTGKSVYHWTVEPAIMCYAMGMFIATNEEWINMKKAAGIGSAILALLLIQPIDEFAIPLLLELPEPIKGFIELWRIRMVLYFVSAPFVLFYLAKHVRRLPFFRRDISYGIYIFGWPIQEIIVYLALSRQITLTSWEVFFLTMPPLIVLAILSATLIEEPAMRLKNKKLFGWITPIRKGA